MLRRLSTRFGKAKKDETNGVNGTNGITNGVHTNGTNTNGISNEKPLPEKTQNSFTLSSRKPKTQIKTHGASRDDVQSSFEQFAHVIHASDQPLPTQNDDGSYIDHKEPSGLMADVKALGFKDVRTLIDVMKNKATGELQDDKTYLMEHTIQVSKFDARMDDTLTDCYLS